MDGEHSTISKDSSSIEGWSKEEKFYLLQALKAFQSSDIERIHEYVSTKTPEQIVVAINHYKNIASKHPLFVKTVKPSKKKCRPRVPLTRWAKTLTDNVDLDELKTETSTAVRLIADLETFPDPACTENIDFKKTYHAIANAMEGKVICSDENVICLLNKCILETALASKAFSTPTTYKYVLNNINLSNTERYSFPKLTEDRELSVLRHLVSQRSYNPLRLEEAYLKPFSITNKGFN